LSAEHERHLFRQYNYLKFQADQMRQSVDPQETTDGILDKVEAVFDQAEEVKNKILRANLRLVVSIARRHVGYSSDFFEAVSDGNLALMRAVEKFDYARGFKFSTYASWAIMRTYARTIPEQRYAAVRMITGAEEVLSTAPIYDESVEHETTREAARQLLQKGFEALTPRERDIVAGHYGLEKGTEPMTLAQIGERFGVSKERVRQIERKAIDKLRQQLHSNAASI
jgi:RNA polymerase sigma factor (sigma-70 family)